MRFKNGGREFSRRRVVSLAGSAIAVTIAVTIAIGLASSFALAASDDQQPAAAPTPTDERTGRLRNAARALVEEMSESRFPEVRERFSAVMLRALSAESLERNWNSLPAIYGPLAEIEPITRVESFESWTAVFVPLRFERGRLDTKVVFDAEGQVDGLFFVTSGTYRTPDYVASERFETSDVSVGSGWFPVPGTLTVPVGTGPFPAVVLVQGSGPGDRDESIGANKPFRDLAEGLASQGIAVIRFDKRTRTHAWAAVIGSSRLTVKQEVIDDVVAAIRLLQADERIDRQRIVVAGHSLGGMLLPRIYQAEPSIAGLIGLAANARPLEDLVLDQTRYLLALDGRLSIDEQQVIEQMEQAVAIVKTDALTTELPALRLPLGVPAAYWLDLRGYEPAIEARAIDRPWLLIQGGRDYQVTATDLARWRHAIGNRSDVTIRWLPELNHLLMKGTGPANPAEYMAPGNVDPQVIEVIVEWFRALPATN